MKKTTTDSIAARVTFTGPAAKMFALIQKLRNIREEASAIPEAHRGDFRSYFDDAIGDLECQAGLFIDNTVSIEILRPSGTGSRRHGKARQQPKATTTRQTKEAPAMRIAAA